LPKVGKLHSRKRPGHGNSGWAGIPVYNEQEAGAEVISFRTGCFCNPGIDELNNGLSPEELKNYFTSGEHGDYDDFINYSKKPGGAVRISIGIATTRADIEKFIRFAEKFLDKSISAFSMEFPCQYRLK